MASDSTASLTSLQHLAHWPSRQSPPRCIHLVDRSADESSRERRRRPGAVSASPSLHTLLPGVITFTSADHAGRRWSWCRGCRISGHARRSPCRFATGLIHSRYQTQAARSSFTRGTALPTSASVVFGAARIVAFDGSVCDFAVPSVAQGDRGRHFGRLAGSNLVGRKLRQGLTIGRHNLGDRKGCRPHVLQHERVLHRRPAFHLAKVRTSAPRTNPSAARRAPAEALRPAALRLADFPAWQAGSSPDRSRSSMATAGRSAGSSPPVSRRAAAALLTPHEPIESNLPLPLDQTKRQRTGSSLSRPLLAVAVPWPSPNFTSSSSAPARGSFPFPAGGLPSVPSTPASYTSPDP